MQQVEFPLISHKSIWHYEPEEFRAYVQKLKQSYSDAVQSRKAKKSTQKKVSGPVPGISFRINAKGTGVLTIRRSPQWITKAEIVAIAKYHGYPQNKLWQSIRKRNIQVVTKDIVVEIN